ncbi:hypothetical protein PENTCL1PPCAC_20088, partial [Pristionchus entomophagus]
LDIDRLIDDAVIILDEDAPSLREIVAGLVYDIPALVHNQAAAHIQIISDLYQNDNNTLEGLPRRLQACDYSAEC